MRKRKTIWVQILFQAVILLFSVIGTGLQARVSVMARPPDWSRLDKFQKTITRDTFVRYLHDFYAPGDATFQYIWIDSDHALIRKGAKETGYYRLEFAINDILRREVPVLWSPIVPGSLVGKKIALDPGHIGGEWAKMEERWFKMGDSQPVVEGDMTLLVAQKIVVRLRQAGALVALVRSEKKPTTPVRPGSLLAEATESLQEKGVANIAPTYTDPNDPHKQDSIQWESELLFYRVNEIRARARLNNELLKPDLTICLHFNAEAWGDATLPTLVEKNHLHLLINGNYSADEIAYDDIRLEMLEKLLSQTINTEIALSRTVAHSLAAATGLPSYRYTTPNARQVVDSPYIWLRNLLANRLYRNPTLYLEPYVMNNLDTFDRIQMGDYPGLRDVHGVPRKSIYNEYADAVIEALTAPTAP